MLPWIRRILLVCALTGVLSPAFAALWSETGSAARSDGSARQFRAERADLVRLLAGAPLESRGDRSQVIEIPLPDGRLSRYSIVESSMMEAELAERYPQLRTYRLFGIDEPIASGRAMLGAKGFSAMLHTASGRILIDPLAAGAEELAVGVSYRQKHTAQAVDLRAPLPGARGAPAGRAALPAARISGSIISYRLAVAATDNYVAAVGASVADAQAEIVRTINRVNSIYERDLGIRLILVGNNDKLIEEKDAEGNDTGCLVNNDAFTILPQAQAWIDTILGSSRYDIGHVFTTDPGGLASLDSVCIASIKAQGTSGNSSPDNDDFYVDIVAHELGHQLGADHSFNGSTGACSGNRNESTAFEPGSGSTIMSYAGLCGGENLQLSSDDNFHAGSIAQINAITNSSGNCFSTLATGNSDPQVATGVSEFTIPALTPFLLDNDTLSDPDADTLSYQWDQMDTGEETNSTTFGRDNGDNVLFRSYPPRLESHRNFPALGTQLEALFDKAEVMACSDRTMEFRLTARDNAGGQVTDDVSIAVDNGAGPFRITSHNSATTVDTAVSNSLTVTWDEAGTDQAPVNCATVDIDLLAFDGFAFASYSVHNLASAVANDGSETVSMPNTTDDSSVSRLRVKCSTSIFYDISDGNLVVDGSGTTPFDNDDISTYFNDNAFNTLTFSEPICGAPRPMRMQVAMAGDDLVDPFASAPAARLAAAGCEYPDSIDGARKDSSSLSPVWMLALLLAVFGLRGWRRYSG